MKRGRRPITDTKPEVLQDLGTAPDHEVAARHGVSTATIGYLRRRHKVPHYGSFAQKSGSYTPVPDSTGLVVYVIRMVEDVAHVLTSGNGIRVYRWPQLDARLLDADGKPPPLIQTWEEAENHLRAEGPCCVPLSVAKQVFSDLFAPPPTPDEADVLRDRLRLAAKEGRGLTLTSDEVAALAGTAR